MTTTHVQVELLAPFSEGYKETMITLDFEKEPILMDVISRLNKRLGRKFEEKLLDSDNKIRQGISVLKNGINIQQMQSSAMKEKISNNCTLVFCIAVSG